MFSRSGPGWRMVWLVCLVLGFAAARPLASRGQDAEELEDVLAAMEAAGLVPSGTELESWSASQAWTGAPPTNGPSGTGWPGSRGRTRVRGYLDESGFYRQDFRVDLSQGHLGGKARFVGEEDGLHFLGGALAIQGKASQLNLGYIGLQSGGGLLLARPGRSGSPTADSAFPRPSNRLTTWSASPDKRTMLGAAMQTRWRGIFLAGLIGRPGLRVSLSAEQVGALSLGLSGSTGSLGLTVLEAGNGLGASLWGHREQGPLAAGGECALWRAGPDGEPSFSGQFLASVRPGPNWHFQAAFAQAGGGFRSPFGQRSAFLKGEDGSGWAARGRWRGPDGVKLALLIAESRIRTPLPEPRREHFRTWDFSASLKIKRQVLLEMRVRSYFSRRWLWDGRFPWLPASLSGRQERFQGQLGLTWDQGMGRLRLVGRILQIRTEDDSASRDLVQLDYRRTLRTWLHLRAVYGTAWADPVDLVSAVSPLPGLVLPRHWGRWQSETLLSLGATGAGLELWVAVSRRLAAGDSSLPGSLNSWIELRASW